VTSAPTRISRFNHGNVRLHVGVDRWLGWLVVNMERMISIGWKEAVAELRRRGFIALRLEEISRVEGGLPVKRPTNP
jgi:hypothetical protein